MALLNTAQLEATYGKRLDQLLALPSLTLDELRGGPRSIEALVAHSDPDRNPAIVIPSFENTVALVPESFLPDEEQRFRKRQRIAQLRASPLPESQQSLTRIVSAIDNIQDALVTASVLLRLAALGAPPLRPVAIGAGAAADALATLNVIAAAPLAPLSGKINAKALWRGSLGSQAVRAAQARTIAQALPTVGESLQIAQTSRDLFGVGLQLGPAMGFLGSLAYGLPQTAAFVLPGDRPFRPRDEFFSSPEAAAAAIGGTVDDLLGDVLRTPADLAELAGISQDIPWEDHFAALAAANLGAELGRTLVAPARWQPIVVPRYHTDDPFGRPRNLLTRRMLTEAGITPDQDPPRGIPGATRDMPIVALGRLIQGSGTRTIEKVLTEAPNDRLRSITSGLATDFGFRMIRAFEGPRFAFEVHDVPHTRAVTDTLELGLVPPAGSTLAQRARYLFDAARLYQDPRDPIPTRQLTEIWTRTYRTSDVATL